MSSTYFSLSLSEVGRTLWEADADEVVYNIRSFAYAIACSHFATP